MRIGILGELEWNEMKCMTWMNWNEWIEMNDLKRMNWHEGTLLFWNETKWFEMKWREHEMKMKWKWWKWNGNEMKWNEKNMKMKRNDRRKFRSQASDNMDRWKAEMERVREKTRVEERRAEERISEKRKNQKKEDAGARKGRKVAKHCVFQWFVAERETRIQNLYMNLHNSTVT